MCPSLSKLETKKKFGWVGNLTFSHDGFFLVCNSDEDKILLLKTKIYYEFLPTAFLIRKEITQLDCRQGSIIFEFPFSLQASSHAFAGLGVLHASFFAGFVIDRMFLYLFDNGFLLDFSLESFKRAF